MKRYIYSVHWAVGNARRAIKLFDAIVKCSYFFI